jgi:ribonucleoside-diphosphate reductase alpha chain
MDSFATTVSVALQYGVPLHDLVHKFAHVRFEPSGFTSNPEIPIAKSIIDYIFRWLGSRFLPPEDRATLGLVDRSAAAESSVQPLNFGLGGSAGAGSAGSSGIGSSPAPSPASPPSGATAVAVPEAVSPTTTPASKVNAEGVDSRPADTPRSIAAPASGNGNGNGKSNGRTTLSSLGIGRAQVTFTSQADAPSCADCGSIMVRNGSCYKCLNCGSTSGCS